MAHASVRAAGATLLAAATLLAGCASGYRLDNTVQSFSSLPALAQPPTYRFERLPSQAATAAQAELEQLADPALFRAGLRRDDAAPRYSVQVAARVQPVVSPWADPWGHPFGSLGVGLGGWRRGVGVGFGVGVPLYRHEQPWWQREVSVIVRELPGQRVVYETQATNAGPWLDHAAVLSAMFDAALQGFPQPPAGPRRVDVQIGGKAP